MEEDANSHEERADELFRISAGAEKKLYEKGDFIASKISSLDTYILKKVEECTYAAVSCVGHSLTQTNCTHVIFFLGWLVSRRTGAQS